VRDFWRWHRSFEIFRVQFQASYEAFESSIVARGLVEKEQFVGAYYERPDDGSEEDLVLS